ncbi:rCG40227, partial [Rattus norvegicus]
EERFHLLGL